MAPTKVINRFMTDTDWDGYTKILDVLRGRHVRVTYDRGTLELMTTSPEHEKCKKILAALLECLLDELDIDHQGGGATTFRRVALDRGLEPDECYWIRHVEASRETRDEVLAPDLAIEIEVTRTAMNRLGIYAALGVPEVWRWTSKGDLIVQVLTQPGQYDTSAVSPTFPKPDLTEFERCVRFGLANTQHRAVREFRASIRKTLL